MWLFDDSPFGQSMRWGAWSLSAALLVGGSWRVATAEEPPPSGAGNYKVIAGMSDADASDASDASGELRGMVRRSARRVRTSGAEPRELPAFDAAKSEPLGRQTDARPAEANAGETPNVGRDLRVGRFFAVLGIKSSAAVAVAEWRAPLSTRPAISNVNHTTPEEEKPREAPRPAAAPLLVEAATPPATNSTFEVAPRAEIAPQPEIAAQVEAAPQPKLAPRPAIQIQDAAPLLAAVPALPSNVVAGRAATGAAGHLAEPTPWPEQPPARPRQEAEPIGVGPVKLIGMQAEPMPGENRGQPFEVIEETGEIKVTVRRSKLLQTKFDIYRTAVVDPGICDIVQFSPRELSIIGRGIGSTHVTFWFEGAQQRPHTYLVTVEADGKVNELVRNEYQKLEEILAELFPDSNVRLTVMANKLIVRGQAKDSEEAAQVLALIRSQASGTGAASLASGPAARVLSEWEAGQTSGNRPQLQVVNMLRVPGVQQVALRVKIAEVNRSAARGFGVDVRGNVNFTGNPDGSQLFLQSVLNMATGGTSGPSLLAQFDGDDIQLGLRYLQQHGVIRLLSEPTLVTMSGKAATFVAGGEFAVPTVVGAAGLNAVSTDFRSFGAIISFLPTVTDKDRIRLQVSPEFSQINANLAVGGTPGLNVRAVTTTVEMREGQTLAIAGLLEDNLNTSTRGDIPFLSTIFGRRDASHNETELLILVSPELVQPMDPEEVPPLPGFDITEPDNYQFFVKGQIEGTPTRDFRSTVWPRLRQRYNSGGTSMISGPFGHGQ